MTLPDWPLYTLIALFALAFVLALAAWRSSARKLRTAHARLATMIDPCADPITIRLQCLEHQLAELEIPNRRRR